MPYRTHWLAIPALLLAFAASAQTPPGTCVAHVIILKTDNTTETHQVPVPCVDKLKHVSVGHDRWDESVVTLTLIEKGAPQ